MRRSLLFLLICGCSTGPDGRAARALSRKPDTVHEFLVDSFRRRHYSDAHTYALSRETKEQIDFPAFYMAFSSRDLTRGLILHSRQHGLRKREGRHEIRVCNLRYGFSEWMEVVPEFGGRHWAIRMSPEQLNRMAGYARERWQHAWRRDDDFFVHPPDTWKKCPCP